VTPSPGPYKLRLTPTALAQREELERTDPKKFKKLQKALAHLSNNPGHPGLGAHKWNTLKGKAPDGSDIWTAYAENNTPGAWRIFYFFDSREVGLIYILRIEPHS